MSEITTIGLDLAKNIFQVHGVDETGTAVVVKTAAAQPGHGVLCRLAAVSGRHGSLRDGTSLGPRVDRAGP